MVKQSDTALDDALRALEKDWGKGFATRGLADANYKAISTGYDDLDDILTKGAKGIYLGGICEISGSEGSGKTAMAMRIVGYAQRLNLNCIWLDAEASFSPDLALLNGCDPSLLIMPELENTKVTKSSGIHFLNVAEILEMIYRTVATGVFSLVVLDSVAALMPDRILQGEDANKVGVAEVARAMSDKLRAIAPACKKHECTVIFINQLRDVPANQWVKDTTPGGRALKFYAAQRIRVDKINGKAGEVLQRVDDGKEEVIGHYARCRVVKNKKNRPIFHPVEIPIYYMKYFPDDAKKCFDLARSLQVVRSRQGVFTWKDTTGNMIFECEGESGFLGHLRNEKLQPRLAAACIELEALERNQKLKIPIVVPSSVRELGIQYQGGGKKEKSKRKISPAIDL